ncbi:hypothetical protein GCM10010195_65660 [Kitasatospora griseola]|nr:hypothetical protein GCM10010195_65660 [Kitasatospora griseola]
MHRRPPGADDATIEALGMLPKALEYTERARGHLYAVHHMTGGADRMLADAVRMLRRAGHGEQADLVERELLGRDVVPGMWTYQLVEAEMRRAARSRRGHGPPQPPGPGPCGHAERGGGRADSVPPPRCGRLLIGTDHQHRDDRDGFAVGVLLVLGVQTFWGRARRRVRTSVTTAVAKFAASVRSASS